jgi:hypothetical protein
MIEVELRESQFQVVVGLLREIVALLQPPVYQVIISVKGNNAMSAQSGSFPALSPLTATLVEKENGSPFTFVPTNIGWTISDPTIASLGSVSATDGSVAVSPLAAGTATLTATDSVTGGTGTYALTVTAVAPNVFDITIAVAPSAAPSLRHKF